MPARCPAGLRQLLLLPQVPSLERQQIETLRRSVGVLRPPAATTARARLASSLDVAGRSGRRGPTRSKGLPRNPLVDEGRRGLDGVDDVSRIDARISCERRGGSGDILAQDCSSGRAQTDLSGLGGRDPFLPSTHLRLECAASARESAAQKRNPPLMKTCSHCHRNRIRADFPPNAHTRDGLSSWCRSCHVEATRAWRSKEHALGRRSVGGRPVIQPSSSRKEGDPSVQP